MDVIQVEKLLAMNGWRKLNGRHSSSYVLALLLQTAMTVLFLGVFCWSPIWVPKAVSTTANLVSARAATACAVLLQPKCLFIVCNVIVVLLVGESRLQQTVIEPDAYGEYMHRYREIREDSGAEGGENMPDPAASEWAQPNGEESGETRGEGKDEAEEELDEAAEDEEDEEKEEDEESDGMSTEELNRRVEEFIAKFNEQRRLEARILAKEPTVDIAEHSEKNCKGSEASQLGLARGGFKL